MLEDNLEAVLEELGLDIDSFNLSKPLKSQAQKLYNYFGGHKGGMRHKTCRKMGLEIGPDAVESAHRTIIQRRLSILDKGGISVAFRVYWLFEQPISEEAGTNYWISFRKIASERKFVVHPSNDVLTQSLF